MENTNEKYGERIRRFVERQYQILRQDSRGILRRKGRTATVDTDELLHRAMEQVADYAQRKKKSFTDEAAFAFIYRTMCNAVISSWRKHRRLSNDAALDGAAEDNSLREPSADPDLLEAALENARRTCPTPMRAFDRHHFASCTLEEIAAEEQVQVATVQRNLRRAVHEIRLHYSRLQREAEHVVL